MSNRSYFGLRGKGFRFYKPKRKRARRNPKHTPENIAAILGRKFIVRHSDGSITKGIVKE